VVRGARHLLHDLRHNGGMPAQTDRTAFTVGRDLAVTPGAVVDRDEVAEVLQFGPTTATLRSRRCSSSRRRSAATTSWTCGRGGASLSTPSAADFRCSSSAGANPTPAQADWDFDTYAGRIVGALQVVKDVTGSPDVNTLGFCAGGILQTTVLSHFAQTATTACTAPATR
jgi:polyhydroxyalkanoate synthase